MNTMKDNKIGKSANIFLWALQILLTFWNITGGSYMMGHYEELTKAWALNALPNFFWIALGVVQIALALALILPGIIKKMHKLIPLSATGLSVLSLLGIALYIEYTGLGILWSLIPAILAGIVAYGRWDYTKSETT